MTWPQTLTVAPKSGQLKPDMTTSIGRCPLSLWNRCKSPKNVRTFQGVRALMLLGFVLRILDCLGLSRVVSGCLGLSARLVSGCLGLSRFVSVCLGLSSMCRAQQPFKIPTFRAARIHCCLLGLFFLRFESLEGVRSVVAVFFDMSCFHWPHFGGPLSVFEVKSRFLGQ